MQWTTARISFLRHPTDEEASGWLLGGQDDASFHFQEEKC
jgi:hypothetical protein